MTRRRPHRIRRRRRTLLLGLLLIVLAAVCLPVLALRWVPPPTTAFMLQSPVKPVRYHWVDADHIATSVKRAVVASEDQKFYEHHGFDFDAMADAFRHNRRARHRRGGSTISQQTAKNLFLWSGGGYARKGIEALITVALETLWSKDRILEVYLNIAEFGPGIYGVDAAAHVYFGKSAAALSPHEAALLAAVLPSPRRWHVRPAGHYVRARSAWILRQMGYAPAVPMAPPPDDTAPEFDPLHDDPPEPADATAATPETESPERLNADSLSSADPNSDAPAAATPDANVDSATSDPLRP